MVNASRIIAPFQIITFVLIILSTLIYSIPLLLKRRFHHRINIFTVNLCMAILCCCIFWITFDIIIQVNVQQLFNVKTCFLIYYAQTMCTVQVPLALVVVSIHRLCCIVYHEKIFFKSMKWMIMCVIGQWITGFVISLPILIREEMVSVCAEFFSIS